MKINNLRTSGGAGRLNRLLRAIAVCAVAVAHLGAAHANDSTYGSTLFGIASSCGDAYKSSSQAGSDCLQGTIKGTVVNDFLLSHTARYADAYGKQVFGGNFSLTNRLTYSSDTEDFSGELDMVIPVASFGGGRQAGFSGGAGEGGGSETAALFLQQGLTRYTDNDGLLRNDLRYGAVHRFSLSGRPGEDVLGFSVFHQQSLEYDHARIVAGLDYNSAWGHTAFSYFKPTTGWRDSLFHRGKEERPLEGMEFSMNFRPTSTISLEAALARWEDSARWQEGGSTEGWVNGGRIGLRWQPHPWVNIGSTWDGIGTDRGFQSVHLSVSIPFGSGVRRPAPRWQGLGLRGSGTQRGGAQDIWRPIENIGRIQVGERTRRTLRLNPDGSVKDVGIRFLQDQANSGESIRIEVTIPRAVNQDTRLEIRLIPGEGGNPAVPGEDFIHEPVYTTIRKGETKSEATLQLILNPDMTAPRALSAKAFLVAND